MKKNAEKSERVAFTVSETVEVAKMIPQLNRKVINATGVTPLRFLTYLPEDKREEFMVALKREYPVLDIERMGEFYSLPFHVWRIEIAITFLRWIGSESGYWEDVKASKTKPFFHWKNWFLNPEKYDKNFLKCLLMRNCKDELRVILPALS